MESPNEDGLVPENVSAIKDVFSLLIFEVKDRGLKILN